MWGLWGWGYQNESNFSSSQRIARHFLVYLHACRRPGRIVWQNAAEIRGNGNAAITVLAAHASNGKHACQRAISLARANAAILVLFFFCKCSNKKYN